MATASAAVGLVTVTGGDVGSAARLDAMARVPSEGTSLVSIGGCVVPGLMRTGVGDKTVAGDEYRWLVAREEDEDDDAGIPVGLGAALKSIVPLAKLAVFAVRRPGAVSKVGGTELGLEATDELSAMVTVLTVTEEGGGDSAAAAVALWPSPSAGPEDTPSLAGPVDMGSEVWPGAGTGTAVSLEASPAGVPSEGKGGLAGARGNAVESSPSPRSETKKY